MTTPATQLAIQKFEEACRVEDLFHRKNDELLEAVALVPARDMAEYVRVTEQMRDKWDTKAMERLARRRNRRRNRQR